ncbi:DNA polymerase IV [Rhizosphaericola mali]|uniref:DNA polymerase IV n=1 Tax=Rhizosphaericola mali TaxID=2545455 RepID=UPI002103FA49|nr:DNA polymerase IV [Rhizosphaericola mali]
MGGSPEGRGGVVATASYEARKFGIRSAMSSKTAQKLCPEVLFVPPRFDVYKEVSRSFHQILHRYTDIIEPLSLDEAYLDVTEDKLGIGSAIEIAQSIQTAVLSELNLTISAGVSINKFLAKVASDLQKPAGLTFIGPSRVESFMESLDVNKFYGVGKVTTEKMQKLGLFKGKDLKKMTENELVFHFGKMGHFFYQIVRGIDDRPVQSYREIKSVSVEDTYPEDLEDLEKIQKELYILVDRLIIRLDKRKLNGRTLTVKIKFHDFTQITRSLSTPFAIYDKPAMLSLLDKIIGNLDLKSQKIRLLGVGISNFIDNDNKWNSAQLALF